MLICIFFETEFLMVPHISFCRLCIASLDKDGRTIYSKSTGIRKISLGKDEVRTYHYSNTPMQYTANFTTVKMTVSNSFFLYVSYSDQNIDSGYS